MDDLSSLDWNAKASQPPPFRSALSPLGTAASRLTPLSHFNQHPLSRPASSLSGTPPPSSKAASPANDSFSNLLSLNGAKNQSNLTLQDRQRQLIEEKKRQVEEQRKRHEQEAGQWESLGRGNTPVNGYAASSVAAEDEDDILAAFKSTATVDRSSHFPPPASNQTNGRNSPAIRQVNGQASFPNVATQAFEDDDDPFGLNSLHGKPTLPSRTVDEPIDDDILGDLGKPIVPKSEARPIQFQQPEVGLRETVPPTIREPAPLDHTLAELVDMGFPADKAKEALQATSSDLQAAVSWLLNQAHEESRQKTKGGDRSERRRSPMRASNTNTQTSSQRRGQKSSEESVPAWKRQESQPSSSRRGQDERSPAGDKDVTQFASEIGSTLFKSANSLWKTGQKKVQKAVADLQQQEGDLNQPKWMRDSSSDPARRMEQVQRPQDGSSRVTEGRSRQATDVTDEALLLESGGARPQRSTGVAPPTVDSRRPPAEEPPSRGRSLAHELPMRPATQTRSHPQPQPQVKPPPKLSRQAVEEEASQAYVSSSRRRRPAPQATPEPRPEPAVDLFGPAPPLAAAGPSTKPTQINGSLVARARAPMPAPASAVPKASPRVIPSISPSAMATSSQHRKAGTEAYKRGDYVAAHESYTAALRPLPASHPITIIVLTNRALTAIKTGDPKVAVSDADRVFSIVGPGKGEGETIEMGAGEGVKDMKEFFGKAVMRKAEALEHMEKWIEAGKVWQEAVECGVGGPVSLQGRDRCERTARGGVAKATVTKSTKPAGTLRKVAPARPVISNAASADAIKKLRAANEAAEKADDEKFRLADSVSARIETWKGGKSDNLRALLGSLDTILWPEAGWRKVGMGDLIIPGKVKIIYMKAIAKVHPDKIPQDATTEQRMVSGTVFSALNEAWDKFKNDNGL